jgi:hypothetical protein
MNPSTPVIDNKLRSAIGTPDHSGEIFSASRFKQADSPGIAAFLASRCKSATVDCGQPIEMHE